MHKHSHLYLQIKKYEKCSCTTYALLISFELNLYCNNLEKECLQWIDINCSIYIRMHEKPERLQKMFNKHFLHNLYVFSLSISLYLALVSILTPQIIRVGGGNYGGYNRGFVGGYGYHGFGGNGYHGNSTFYSLFSLATTQTLTNIPLPISFCCCCCFSFIHYPQAGKIDRITWMAAN